MKHSKKFLFLVAFFLDTHLLFSQEIDFSTDNISISISLQNHRSELFQSWKIINGNSHPIFIPAFKSDSIAPKFEIGKVRNELFISVGLHPLSNSTPQPVKATLLKLMPHDTLSFVVMLSDQKSMAMINKASYNSFQKNISFDYLTEEDFEKIRALNNPAQEISSSKYFEVAKYIRFKFLYSYY